MRQDDQMMASERMSHSETGGIAKRVAVLLIRNLSDALRERRIETADSELHWLMLGQCEESEGGIQLFPSRSLELMQYARENNFRPLGVVVLAENGDFSDFMNEDAIATEDLDFAKHLFHVHALFWCFCFPSTPDSRRSVMNDIEESSCNSEKHDWGNDHPPRSGTGVRGNVASKASCRRDEWNLDRKSGFHRRNDEEDAAHCIRDDANLVCPIPEYRVHCRVQEFTVSFGKGIRSVGWLICKPLTATICDCE